MDEQKKEFPGSPVDYQHETVNSLVDIIEIIKQNFDPEREIWFRGQPSFEYELVPFAFRNPKYDEYSANYEFQLQFPEEKNKCSTMFDWLTILQHYGIPTRLLDWSRNLFVGLFFACSSSNIEKDSDGSLFAFDPLFYGGGFYETDNQEVEIISQLTNMTNLESFGYDTKVKNLMNLTDLEYSIQNKKTQLIDIRNNGDDVSFMLENILPVKPKKIFHQITVQDSVFTIHGGKFLKGEEVIKIAALKTYHPPTNKKYRILKIKINKQLKIDILSNLKLLGFSEKTLFIDMTNQAKFIKNKYYI